MSTTYIITCTACGESQMNHEYLGDARGVEYPTQQAAQAVADGLMASVAEYGLHPSTTYSVEAA